MIKTKSFVLGSLLHCSKRNSDTENRDYVSDWYLVKKKNGWKDWEFWGGRKWIRITERKLGNMIKKKTLKSQDWDVLILNSTEWASENDFNLTLLHSSL